MELVAPKNSREIVLLPQEIIFDDSVDIDGTEASAYLCETRELDIIAGLNPDQIIPNDLVTVNFYGVYDGYTDSFRVDCCVTVDDMDYLAKESPELLRRLGRYTDNHVQDISIDLTPDQHRTIFERFKDYVLYEDGYDSFDDWRRDNLGA